MDPLVSVMMPCYDMAASLPWALGSLMVQTYGNWECILVDDGSTDDPRQIVDAFQDERLKYVRLEQNMGRGVARGVALNHTRGTLLSMLDADDWMFPDRLETQVTLLKEFPDATLVDSGVAVVDSAKELRGVIRSQTGTEPVVRGPLSTLWRLPVSAYASCMIRGHSARQARFDSVLRWGEDQDFLFQILLNGQYILWSGLHYVYTGYKTTPLEEILTAYRLMERVYGKYTRRFPLTSRLLRCHFKGKAMIRKAIYPFEGDRLLSSRYDQPTPQDREKLAWARRRVADFVEKIF
jgi:glycosyltransferase involved in cell wall biosynthesis